MSYDSVIERVSSMGLLGRAKYGGGYMARCPTHEDNVESLSITEGERSRALIFCFAGCDTAKVVADLGLQLSDLFDGDSGESSRGQTVVAQYVYTDAEGRPAYRRSRTFPKGFFQEVWAGDHWALGLPTDAPRYPYHLPRLARAVELGEPIYIVEGEKDVETIERFLGPSYSAATTFGGSNDFRAECVEYFRGGVPATIIADDDEPGRLAALRTASAFSEAGLLVNLALPPKGYKDCTAAWLDGRDPLDLRAFYDDEMFGPIDWTEYEAEEIEWLYEPYIPARARVLLFGAAGSLKSLWAAWVATKLAREGHKVAYFSLEMQPHEAATRMKKMDPPKENFRLFTKFKLGNPDYLEMVCNALQGYSLIVIDSFNAAYQFFGQRGRDDDQMAVLDNEVFQPLTQRTGAALLILDNTGKPVWTDDGPHEQTQARGTSAKGDKMDLTLMLSRPYEDNNYLTDLRVTKMRLDTPIPQRKRITAPREKLPVEFFVADMETGQALRPLWRDRIVTAVDGEVIDPPAPSPSESAAPLAPAGESLEGQGEMTLSEKLAAARLKQKLGATELEEASGR